jgi:hypothetical protein
MFFIDQSQNKARPECVMWDIIHDPAAAKVLSEGSHGGHADTGPGVAAQTSVAGMGS